LEDARERAGGTAFYNIVTILFLFLTILSVAFVALIYLNPNASFNPFPPQSALPTPTLFVIPSATPTEEGAEPPPTEPASAQPTVFVLTATEVVAGGTPLPEETAGATPPGGETPTSVATGLPGTPTLALFPFAIQDGTPEFTQNTEANGGCEFMGLVGQVFDLSGQPVDGIAVVAKGENFETLYLTQFSTAYGPGSYQIELNNAPIEAEFEVQLWSVAGQALSDAYVVRTREACEENLIFVNFVQNREFEF
jgi:hypothetical protein